MVHALSGWFAKGLKWDSAKTSEDGWRCLADNPTQTPVGINPCTYFRVPDIPSGIANQEIGTLEKACSFVADGVRANSQAPLFVKATDIDNLPRTDSTGKIIGVKGAVEELKAADAKFLTPPNLSDIATIDIANKEKSIRESTMSVDISPEIFRAADPSSAANQAPFYRYNYLVQERVCASLPLARADGRYFQGSCRQNRGQRQDCDHADFLRL